MRKRATSIPVNPRISESGEGIDVERLSFKDLPVLDKSTAHLFEDATQAHRDDSHAFFLLEKGTVSMEIDFQKYTIRSPSLIYIHPNQVHRIIAFKNVTVCSWAINDENLHAGYLKLLEEIAPAKPLALNKKMFALIAEAVSLCIKFFEWKNNRLRHSLVKDSCNALVALVVSQYMEQSGSTDKSPRFELITKAFKELLEHHYTGTLRPAEYARQLNISTAYLNECIKNTTGYSVSHHIQQRVILEAKRMLYHSDKSVKEIAALLGYEDYPYFSRLFTKVAGMTALAFRNKNHD